ncbi:MAG TPA: GspH/FimT family pseudopilin [Burkholderiales bacterium]
MLIYPKSLAGFTLIELMFAIAIVGILLAAGLPEASQWTQNTKIRTKSESISNGLQLARGEAVRRNTRIQFMLTNSTPNVATLPALAAGNTGSTTGVNWVVMNYQSTGVYTAPDFVQGGGNEVTTSSAAISSTDATVVFNGLGRSDIVAANVTIQVTNPAGGACVAASGPMRCLNVVVLPGGQIRMCDPSIATAGDTRKC